MEFIALIVFPLLLAGGVTAFKTNRVRTGFTDKDKDGAPEDPAAGLKSNSPQPA